MNSWNVEIVWAKDHFDVAFPSSFLIPIVSTLNDFIIIAFLVSGGIFQVQTSCSSEWKKLAGCNASLLLCWNICTQI